jgi:hypothetical protein
MFLEIVNARKSGGKRQRQQKRFFYFQAFFFVVIYIMCVTTSNKSQIPICTYYVPVVRKFRYVHIMYQLYVIGIFLGFFT